MIHSATNSSPMPTSTMKALHVALSMSPSTTGLPSHEAEIDTSTPIKANSRKILQQRKREWIERSTHYYTTVMRHQNRQARGQIKTPDNQEALLNYHKKNMVMAQNLYFARNQIKYGRLNHAESIYRKLIDDIMGENKDGHECDHAQLAVSTLLLALLLQRKDQIKETRSTFLQFFRIINTVNEEHLIENGQVKECACSAKVLQAFALFEMKQGLVKKSYQLATMAVRMDHELEPILNWKQFREAKELVNHPSRHDLLAMSATP
eukprot:CAMPEP_0204620782 /NCGR_PEP_ID=MMETSP0717-20131115/6706_1 /ASSEMBLY_ACC=CAM_ASM_000666 /TAXON_ID=230516 /ORGANISM="Chaetoceros curvisetus" /LENGTH=263 /DNA_ID=CAMNT_0051635049 /DNA_START=280 /DNA_END=1071 /DNA_ORIENTATION=-